jgi:transcription elongation factor GreA
MKEKLENKLKEEIRKVERELTVEIPREINEAVQHGDLTENAEYLAALERQNYLQHRLAALNKQLSNLSLISLNTIPRDKAALGSTVTIKDLETNEVKTFHLVLGDLANPENGEISPSSPIGKALAGGSKGDYIEIKTPGGTREYEIIDLITLYDTVDDK